MNTKLQRNAGMYPARYGGEGHWPHHPDAPDACPARHDEHPTGISDPYEVAYLRGDENAVLTLALFDLAQRGHLQVVETKRWLGTEQKLQAAENPPSHDRLTDAEKDLIGRFSTPLAAGETFSFGLTEALRSACSGYRTRFEETGLLRTQGQAKLRRMALGVAAFVGFIALAAAKAPLPMFLTCFAAVIAASALLSSRLTAAGKAHLKRIEARLARLKDRPKAARLGAADPLLLTAVGVFGVPILAGSAYDAFAAAVKPMASGTWSFSADGCGGDGCGGCGCGCGGE